MNNDLQISDDFILPLFDELYEVKERDFSIEYHPLGLGRQKLLMLVSSDSHEYLNADELTLLQTIVDKGLRKQMDDAWVVNISKFPNASVEKIWDHFKPMQVIVWGCQNWINNQSYNTELHKQAYINGAELLQANALLSYITDPTGKAKLWAALQRMFFN
ncbi:MAG: hypothetical protein SGJ00_00475 [bacterium]|nr:hypothetical protein [bacterium]